LTESITAVNRDGLTGVAPDPRRWFTLAIVITSILIVALDNSILTVAIPTILRDFHTSLASLQWVVAGYALVFATLLIIGGRLGDIFGHRRIFIIGVVLFGSGSLLAALSWSVPSLVVGEAIIEGIGASLMMPATLAILSTTFRGRERATAFAVWGTTAGVAAVFGPFVGGFLTTNYSWRWAFGINVIVAPLAITGALFFMRKGTRADRRMRIDIPGALLVAVGLFLLVFALSEGGTYGWLDPIKTFRVAGTVVWPSSFPISMIPLVVVASAVTLAVFTTYERLKERRDESPLFEFSQLRHRGFRYGLLTTLAVAMGQLGMLFVIPVFLQDGKRLSAETSGYWILPVGVFVLVGAQLGGRLTRQFGVTKVVRVGLLAEIFGLLVLVLFVRPSLTFVELVGGFLFFGFGIGFANSQLTNVVLSDIDPDKSGVASGANATLRQVGGALGVAVIGSMLTTRSTHHTVDNIASAPLAAGLKAEAIARVHAIGLNYRPGVGVSRRDAAVLLHAVSAGISSGARPALLFAAAAVAVGAVFAMLMPPIGPPGRLGVDAFEPFEPIEPDPALRIDPAPSS